jgi:hypothetical protein
MKLDSSLNRMRENRRFSLIARAASPQALLPFRGLDFSSCHSSPRRG